MPSTMPESVRRQLPLRPKLFHILLALAAGPRHGYAIKKEVEEGSNNVVRMGAGSLYEGIHLLEKRGLIRETTPPPSGGAEHSQRRYYDLTALGTRVLGAEAARLRDLLELAYSRLGGEVEAS